MVKERRCNLFDDNGKPRRMRDGSRGCYRDASACHFAHPHEREWLSAASSFPPKQEFVVDSDSEFYYSLLHSDRHKKDKRDFREREVERERERDGERTRERDVQRKPSSSFHADSPPHRRESTARTSPRPGTSSRRPTFDSAMNGGGTKRGKSPALSTSSDQLERLRKDSKYCTNDRDPASHGSHSPRDREWGNMSSKPSPTASHTTDTRFPTARHPSTLPPEPSKPPPMQPPPPIPEVPIVPSFASNNQQPASPAETTTRGLKELSIDEQRLAWHERIDLMFTSITSRRDYSKLESDLSQIRLLSSSSLVNNLPEADRARISAQEKALALEMEAKRKEINDTIQKLIVSNFWPVLRTPQISEMEKTVGVAKKHVLEVRSLLDDVKSSCAALFKTSVSDWTQDSGRPSKRRRLDGEADSPAQSKTGNAEIIAGETKELEVFRDKFMELDRHLVDLENDITQRDQIISDEIELRIEARLEEEGALYPPVEEPSEVSQAEIEAVVNAKNEEFMRAVTVTGEEIGVLAVEVADLMTKVNALEARCKALEVENEGFKNKFAQDTLQCAKTQEALARRDKEIEAIVAALQAYISQAPACQPTGDLHSAEYIIESLDSQLDGLLREKFGATLVNIRQEVVDKVQESHTHTLNVVSPKIMLLLKMVNLITARLGRPDMIQDVVNTG